MSYGDASSTVMRCIARVSLEGPAGDSTIRTRARREATIASAGECNRQIAWLPARCQTASCASARQAEGHAEGLCRCGPDHGGDLRIGEQPGYQAARVGRGGAEDQVRGFAVQRGALRYQLLDPGVTVANLQQRAARIAACAAADLTGRGLKIDDQAARAQHVPIVGAEHHAAA